jgi:hypothetical protein
MWGWPQLTYLGLTILGMGIILAKHGDPAPDYDVRRTFFSTGLTFFLLYMGGFFT